MWIMYNMNTKLYLCNTLDTSLQWNLDYNESQEKAFKIG